MNKKIVFASSNKNKVKIVKDIFEKILSDIEIVPSYDVGFFDNIEKTGLSFYENALLKAKALSDYLKIIKLDYPVLAEDSGFSVDLLSGFPGISSNIYSLGEEEKYTHELDVENTNPNYQHIIPNNLDERNNIKVLREISNLDILSQLKHTAHFIACFVFVTPNGEIFKAEGKIDGEVTDRIVDRAKSSNDYESFGYDNIFYFTKFKRLYQAIGYENILNFSHRRIALDLLKESIENYFESRKA